MILRTLETYGINRQWTHCSDDGCGYCGERFILNLGQKLGSLGLARQMNLFPDLRKTN